MQFFLARDLQWKMFFCGKLDPVYQFLNTQLFIGFIWNSDPIHCILNKFIYCTYPKSVGAIE